MRKNLRKIGSFHEEEAARYLESCGYVIVARNYHVGRGEIDIIAKEGEVLSFVEVKYRSLPEKTGNPLEAVTKAKQKKIYHAALTYIARHGIDEFSPFRFDVVAITSSEIRLIRNAFEVERR